MMWSMIHQDIICIPLYHDTPGQRHCPSASQYTPLALYHVYHVFGASCLLWSYASLCHFYHGYLLFAMVVCFTLVCYGCMPRSVGPLVCYGCMPHSVISETSMLLQEQRLTHMYLQPRVGPVHRDSPRYVGEYSSQLHCAGQPLPVRTSSNASVCEKDT